MRDVLRYLRLLLVTRNLTSAFRAWQARIPWMHLERRDGTVKIRGTDFLCNSLPKSLPAGISFWMGKLGWFGFSFEILEPSSTLVVNTGRVRLRLDGADVALIAEEVFGTMEYGWLPRQDSVVVDIGMNVGTTSLYFAKEESVRRVVAFEPCLSTLERGRKNLALNPELSGKIEVRPYALGGRNGRVRFQVDPTNSAISRMIPDDAENRGAGLEDGSVEIRDAEAELRSLVVETPVSGSFVLKIDCEGAEREILARLSLQTLGRMDVILLEWHHQDILVEIREKLDQAGFDCVVHRISLERGMLYAVRRASTGLTSAFSCSDIPMRQLKC